MSNRDRKVSRVLVLLDYGDGDPDSGEVFDLTALTLEIAAKTTHRSAGITLRINTQQDYSEKSPYPLYNLLWWSVRANYDSSGETGHLDDAINASMPDSFKTQDMQKKMDRLSKRVEKLHEDIKVQRLMDAAAIRHQHPIARVRETALLTVAGTEPPPNGTADAVSARRSVLTEAKAP